MEGAQVYALDTMYCGKVVETAAMVQGNYTSSRSNEEVMLLDTKVEVEPAQEQPVEEKPKKERKTRAKKVKKEDDK